ncbi:MAG: PhoH family protein [Acidobacteria bacterium]|nr:PhoH family protein [Acidobacteriota bacterium]
MTTVQVNLPHGIETLFGTRDENIRFLESSLGVTTHLLPDSIEISGRERQVHRAREIIADYESLVRDGHKFANGDLKGFLKVVSEDPRVSFRNLVLTSRQRLAGRKSLAPRSLNQMRYFEAMDRCDMVYGVGPAGTGKTYLAVAQGVNALLNKQVRRIILARPAVEAGERLGFLPGTLQQKIDPYLRPLYDALYDMLEAERVEKLIEKNVIEIAPLAFMRGRSLNESFIILDEAQNATSEQMKMFITRLGFGSRAVITGDVTQIDLPSGKRSGLLDAIDILSDVEGIAFVYFNEKDVVRHDLVARIIRAYDRYNRKGLFPTPGEALSDDPAVLGASPAEPLPALETETDDGI